MEVFKIGFTQNSIKGLPFLSFVRISQHKVYPSHKIRSRVVCPLESNLRPQESDIGFKTEISRSLFSTLKFLNRRSYVIPDITYIPGQCLAVEVRKTVPYKYILC